MKFAVIGSAHGHVFEYVKCMTEAGGDFCGILDDGEKNTAKLQEKYGAPVFQDVGDILAQKPLVAGCFGPNHSRINAAELCAANGIHVMSDKPLVTDRKGLERLEKILADGKIQVGMMLTVRFMPCICLLKQILESGEIGDLVNIEIFNPHKLNPASRPDWHFSKKESGGVAVDLLTHSVDLLYWLSGRSPLVQAHTMVTKSILPEKPEFSDLATAHLLTENQISAYLRVDWHIPDNHWNWGDMRIFCIGTTGYAEIRATGDPLTHLTEVIVFSPTKGTVSLPLPPFQESAVSDFLKRIAGQECCITQEDVAFTCRTCIELDEQARMIDRTH